LGVRRDVIGLAAEAHGPLDGPPVLLIAGGGGDRRSWRRVVPELCRTAEERTTWMPVQPALSESFRVAVFDQAGVGESAGLQPRRTASELATDALAVGTSLLGSRFIVLGQSLGGCAAIQLALDHPEVVAGLVLVGTFGGLGAFVAAGPRAPAVLGEPPDPDLMADGEAEARSFSSSFPTREPDLFWQVVTETPAQHPQSASAQIEVFMSHESTARLGELSMPTVVICGNEDQTFPLENSEQLANRIGPAELRVVDAGHGIHLEAPGQLVSGVAAIAARGA
jgi:3-oxoadipate enol-lactonase